MEPNNTEDVFVCGLKGDKFYGLLLDHKRIQTIAICGKGFARLDIFPSATVSELYSLLYTVGSNRKIDY